MALSSLTTTATTEKRSLDSVNTVTPPAKKARKEKKLDLDKETKKVVRAINGQISSRLKWKASYKFLNGGNTKGFRVEVPCSYPEVFSHLFPDVKTKGEKMTSNIKTDDGVSCLPFKGKSYRYSSAKLRGPASATFSDYKITFSCKFSIW